MKTPEEIKAQALDESGCCGQCDFYCTTVDNPFGCQEARLKTELVAELIAYTEQLESDNEIKQKRIDELESRLAQVEMERDAAVRDLNCFWKCAICKKFTRPVDKCPHYRECGLSYKFWQWRGVCPENTKEDET